MRWHEIFREFEQGISGIAKSYILDLLAPLKAQGVQSITVKQLIDQLQADPDLEGNVIDQQFVMDMLKGQKNIRIETDPNNGEMTVFLDDQTPSRQVDHKKSEQEAKHIRQAAVRQATKGD
jgi:hypothetical protein